MVIHVHPAFLFLAACGLAGGCVSVEEYTQLRTQLEIEQRHTADAARRDRQLQVLVDNLQKRLRLCELTRDEALAKLEAARKALPLTGAAAGASSPGSANGPHVTVGTLLFDAGHQGLSEDNLREVARIAAQLAKTPGGQIVVSGHSDPTPIGRTQFTSNMHLSAVRALAVYHALVREPGILPSRVSVAAYGEFRPKEGDPAQLRRVEVLYFPDAQK
jgi:flagellar motor protein MotB